ncbi:DeoR/GlpR family DNA-binding transcription regulator [Kribbella sp. NPDC050124]|uniref:DeoR/GlpR family DNA-binding transcription regulator n=1 Tax=Kribbella sp. NPDC050124 TaxID=3364114 RepID=UPI0037B1DF63
MAVRVDSEQRLRLIVERVRNSRQVSIDELASLTGSSAMTIRRDLALLHERGALQRVRGGAVPAILEDAERYLLSDRRPSVTDEAIARTVVELIDDGQSLVLDHGPAGLEVAKLLVSRAVTVVPLSLRCAMLLRDAPRVRLVLPAGEAGGADRYLVGPQAVSSLQAMRVDLALISPCGLSAAGGLTAVDASEADIKRQAISIARRTAVLIDGAKWGRRGPAKVCPADQLDLVISDAMAPPQACAALAEAGVEVRIVGPEIAASGA